jgi:hypothetical protein
MTQGNPTMPTVAESGQRLADARQAHAAARERHVTAADATWRASDRNQAAVNQHARLADGVVAGGQIDETALRRAREAVEDAHDALQLHRGITTSALAAIHRAEVDLLTAIAVDHRARACAAHATLHEAAIEVDQAIDAAGGALQRFEDGARCCAG